MSKLKFTSESLALLIWILGWGAHAAGPELGQLLEYLALATHLEHFLKGLINYLKVFKKYFDHKAYDLHNLFPKTPGI